MALFVDQRELLLRVVAPEHEDRGVGAGGDGPDHGVGDLLPALALVGVGLACAHRQHRVEEEHPLLGPRHQIPVVRDRQAELLLHLLVDVAQGGRRLHARPHGEAQAVPLPLAVVGVLAEDQDLHLVVRSRFQSREHLLPGRIDRPVGPLLLDEFGELPEVGALKLLAEDAAPGFRQRVGVGHVNNLR